MTDIAVENARRRAAEADERILEIQLEIKSLSEELSKVQAERDRAQAFINAWAEFAGVEVEAISGTENKSASALHMEPTGSPAPPKIKRVKNPKKEHVASKARELILAHGKPMGRTDLFKALSDAGVTLQGKNPEMVLSTMLWRMNDEIVRIQPYGYWPADVANTEVGYDPEADSSNTSIPNYGF